MTVTGRILRGAAIAALAFGFLWGLFHFGATRTGDLNLVFLILILPAAAALLGLFGGQIFRTPGMLFFLALGCFLAIQAGTGTAVEGRGYVLLALGWCSFALTFAVASRSLRACRWFFLALIGVGLLETLYGLLQAVAGVDYIGGYYRNMGRVATGTLFNRNHYAGLLNLTLPLALGALFAAMMFRPGRRNRRSESLAQGWIILLAVSFMGLAVLLSQSRGGVITLALCLLATAVLLRVKKRRQPFWLTAAPAVFVLLVTVLGAAIGVDSLLAKFGGSNTALLDRAAVYRDTLTLIGEHPLGVGPGMYAWRFRPYQTVSGHVWFDYAHNDYLQTAAEWGVPIALVFWAWLLWRFCRGAVAFLRSHDPWIQGISLGCAISIFSILLHSLVDFNLYIPANFMVFCSVLALGLSVQRLKTSGFREGEPV